MLIEILALAAAGGAVPKHGDVCFKPETMAAEQILACYDKEIARSDARLNAVYKRALGGLDPVSRGKLVEAQRSWVAFREADIAANRGPWRASRSTIVEVQAAANAVSAIDERADELQSLYVDHPAGEK